MKIRYFKNRFLGGLFKKVPHPEGSFSRGVDFCPYFCSALRGSLNVQNGTFYGGGYLPASQTMKTARDFKLVFKNKKKK
jgi:hypothetical protein